VRILPGLSYASLGELAARIRAGQPIPAELSALELSVGRAGLAGLLEAVAAERKHAESVADGRIELVWSGPEREGAGSRDTAVLVRELFSTAERTVDVSGYAIHDGESIFAQLADRMEANSLLVVRLFVNVHRPTDGHVPDSVVVEQFRSRFFEHHWPWERRPQVFFYPKSLDPSPATRAVLHAKCVIVDRQRALVTSANLTEAAQYRNIEAGVLVNDEVFSSGLAAQFSALVEMGVLRPL
jgi:phosphatidylserine/phosphatidylglycerophosphate/cardiolipin synthase-like enzyme